MQSAFHKIINSSYINMFIGIILVYTSGKEIYETLDHVVIGSHHGVFIFGLAHLLKHVQEFRDGTMKILGKD